MIGLSISEVNAHFVKYAFRHEFPALTKGRSGFVKGYSTRIHDVIQGPMLFGLHKLYQASGNALLGCRALT